MKGTKPILAGQTIVPIRKVPDSLLSSGRPVIEPRTLSAPSPSHPVRSLACPALTTMSFALESAIDGKTPVPALYLMFKEEDLVPPPGTRSHAKKKPASYIPRPKNAFIIFRTMYSKWNSMLPRAQDPGNPHIQLAITDHRTLSKAAGDAWRRMTEEEKAPYKELADADKAQHKLNYPDYKYSPGERAPPYRRGPKPKTAAQRSESPPSSTASDSQDNIVDEIVTLQAPPRRSSSCPPPTATIHNGWSTSNILMPPPFSLPQQQYGEHTPAPVFTDPWSNGLVVAQENTQQRGLDPLYWRRGSKDDFRVHYGQQGGYSQNAYNTMSSFSRRVSKDDSYINYQSYEPTSFHHQPTLPPLPSTSVEDQWSLNVPQDTRWDRKRSMDDLDMHLMNTFPQVTRIAREHGGRRASRDDSAINYGHSSVLAARRVSRDDIGINYGYAPARTHWNDVRVSISILFFLVSPVYVSSQILNPTFNPSPLRMAISPEYSHQDPMSALSPCEPTATSPDMGDISNAFSPLNPYTVSSVASGIMPLQLDNTNVPPPVLDLSSPGTELELREHEAIQFNNYSLSGSAGDYQYTEYNAASTPYYEQGSVGPHDISREGTSTPEFDHRNMPMYHQHAPQPNITSP